MIAFIQGVVEHVGYDSVIVDVSGVGYSAQMHVRDVAVLTKGQNIRVNVSEVIREQSYDLYGFTEIEDKIFFDVLMKVSGVGPRIGLALLGIANRDEIASAIQSGNISLISSAPGIGKRLAERIIVELKDKISGSVILSVGQTPNIRQTEEALLALGFNSNDTKNMLKSVDTSLSIEEQIRQALKER